MLHTRGIIYIWYNANIRKAPLKVKCHVSDWCLCLQRSVFLDVDEWLSWLASNRYLFLRFWTVGKIPVDRLLRIRLMLVFRRKSVTRFRKITKSSRIQLYVKQRLALQCLTVYIYIRTAPLLWISRIILMHVFIKKCAILCRRIRKSSWIKFTANRDLSVMF